MEKWNENRMLTTQQWDSLRLLVEAGNIKTFNSIFDYVKGSNFSSSIGMHYKTLMNRIKTPKSFSYRETSLIAAKMGVSKRLISELVNNQIDADLAKKG